MASAYNTRFLPTHALTVKQRETGRSSSMGPLVALDMSTLEDLSSEIKELLQNIDASLKKPCDQIDIHELFRFYHTLKGAVAVYAFSPIVNCAHAIEDQMEPIRAGDRALTETDQRRLILATRRLKSIVVKSLKPVYSRLNRQTRKSRQGTRLRIVNETQARRDIETSRSQQRKLNPQRSRKTSSTERSLSPVLERLALTATSLAQSQGKQLVVRIVGGELVVDYARLRPLFINALHLIRNSVDHGIEMPRVRLSLGKPARATLKLIVRQYHNLLTLYIADDGAGIDLARVRRVAVRNGLLSPATAGRISPKKLLRLIFRPGFSLKKTVTEISGRGVGMDAIKAAVDQLRGRIDVYSVVNKGTIIKITIPMNVVASMSQRGGR